MEDSGLYRKKSLDKVRSPEQLDDYIRVAGSGVWMILAGIIVILAGVCIWGFAGRLDTVVQVPMRVDGGRASILIPARTMGDTGSETAVRWDDIQTHPESIPDEPVPASEAADEYFIVSAGIDRDEPVYICPLKGDFGHLNDGYYMAEVLVDSVSPMYFILN